MAFNILDIECGNKELLHAAFTHPSYTKENNISYLKSYERLEFLGDAVLKLLTSKLLYKKYPEYKEGELSKIRSILVSDNILAKIGRDISLDKKLILGAGEEHTGGAQRESNIACAMEAVFAAYYLDGQIETVEKFIESALIPYADEVDKHFEKYNAKAVLQEYTQKESGEIPIYETIGVFGPQHNPEFEIQVSYSGKVLSSARGKSKKEAQQNCAYRACLVLGIIKENDDE